MMWHHLYQCHDIGKERFVPGDPQDPAAHMMSFVDLLRLLAVLDHTGVRRR